MKGANILEVGGRKYRILPGRDIITVAITIASGSTAENTGLFEAPNDLLIRNVTAYFGAGLNAVRLAWRNGQGDTANFPVAYTNAEKAYPVASTVVTDMSAQPLPRWDLFFRKGSQRTFIAQALSPPASNVTFELTLHCFPCQPLEQRS